MGNATLLNVIKVKEDDTFTIYERVIRGRKDRVEDIPYEGSQGVKRF